MTQKLESLQNYTTINDILTDSDTGNAKIIIIIFFMKANPTIRSKDLKHYYFITVFIHTYSPDKWQQDLELVQNLVMCV